LDYLELGKGELYDLSHAIGFLGSSYIFGAVWNRLYMYDDLSLLPRSYLFPEVRVSNEDYMASESPDTKSYIPKHLSSLLRNPNLLKRFSKYILEVHIQAKPPSLAIPRSIQNMNLYFIHTNPVGYCPSKDDCHWALGNLPA
jgi:hypothetical protein